MRETTTILIVDDDDDDLEFFCDAVHEVSASVDCITASSWESALKKILAWEALIPDFIFLDLNMPRMNGKQCLVEIKKMEAYRRVPVIIYSTSSDNRIVQDALDLGAAHFLSKPNRHSELCQAIRYILTADLTRRKRFMVS